LLVAASASVAGLSVNSPARAEGWMMDATAQVGTGLEGGDPGGGDIEWRRARTRILAGFDLRSDEDEEQSLGVRGFAELERRGGVGGEVRYERWLGRGLGGFVFATGLIAPETLVGAGFGATSSSHSEGARASRSSRRSRRYRWVATYRTTRS
jgi:hypothetical protein